MQSDSIVRRSGWVIVAVVVSLVPYAVLTYRFNWVCDDAFISFRYARHLAAGDGLRYNLGVQPPVEGFSNLLWVLIMAPIEAAGWSTPVWSRVLSILCGVVLVFRLTRFVKEQLALTKQQSTLCAIFFTTLPPIAVWSTSGLATMPFTLVLFLTFESLWGNPKPVRTMKAALACSLLVVLRAEGFVWAIIILALAVRRLVLHRERQQVRSLITCAIITALTLVVLTVFRLLYYGYPLPNTAYAKVGLSILALERGLKYTANFYLVFPHLLWMLVVGARLAWRNRDEALLLIDAIVMICCVSAYAVAVGGDFMAMGRFMVPSLPFFCVMFAVIVLDYSRRSTSIAVWTCACTAIMLSLLPAFNIHVVPFSLRAKTHFRWNTNTYESEYAQWKRSCDRVLDWKELGEALKSHTLPSESIVRTAIGAVGYYSELFIYDRAGLVNSEVAHSNAIPQHVSAAHDKLVPLDYFLPYNPTYIDAVLMETLPVARFRGYIREYEHGIHRSREAQRMYAPIATRLGSVVEHGPGTSLVCFKRIDRIYGR